MYKYETDKLWLNRNFKGVSDTVQKEHHAGYDVQSTLTVKNRKYRFGPYHNGKKGYFYFDVLLKQHQSLLYFRPAESVN